MSRVVRVPLVPRAQKFRIPIEGTDYILRVVWNNRTNSWVMDVRDGQGAPVLLGVPLVTGTNLLGQFDYLGIGGGVRMVVVSIGPGRSPDEVPSYSNLGTDSNLYYIVP